jgi:sialate O-acetylesterase
MIASWRKEWGQGDFPFLIVELAPYLAIRDNPTGSDYATVREAQRMTAKSVPNCGIATTTDIGAAKDPHPKNKQEVGRRLSLVALAKVYGKDVVYSGPVYKSMTVKGNQVRVKFEQVHAGLVTKPEGPIKGFAVAGKDQKFVWAQAKIEGDSVVVWSDEVKEPVAVRYAWASNPVCNLCNGAGLPAFPFRTDDWEATSEK